MAVGEVTVAFPDCVDAFDWAKTSHVCIPRGDVSTQVSVLLSAVFMQAQCHTRPGHVPILSHLLNISSSCQIA